MGCHFLLQGIFPTQGSNPCLLRLLHWQVDSFPVTYTLLNKPDIVGHPVSSFPVYTQGCLCLVALTETQQIPV